MVLPGVVYSFVPSFGIGWLPENAGAWAGPFAGKPGPHGFTERLRVVYNLRGGAVRVVNF
ncbi:hypothetical protein BR1R5_32730 [Pseudomonas sp. BR1R-5]|nr:hypothetical protein BR1R5_32730 [Pseudomonas sp. BR1R-5]